MVAIAVTEAGVAKELEEDIRRDRFVSPLNRPAIMPDLSPPKSPTSLKELEEVLKDDIKVKVAGKNLHYPVEYLLNSSFQASMVRIISSELLVFTLWTVDGVPRGKYMESFSWLLELRQ